MNFIGKNFLNLLVLAIIAFMLLRECNTSSQLIQRKPDTVTVVDTTYITKSKTITKKIHIVSVDSSYDISKDKRFTPDTSYEVLKTQFEKLSKDYTIKKIYKDTLVLDSIGFIHITDTVQSNSLLGRKYLYSYTLPTVTKTTTTTNYPKSVRQLYAGLGISTLGLSSINVGIMYKSRRDQLYGFTLNAYNGQLVYGVQTYFKIKLRK